MKPRILPLGQADTHTTALTRVIKGDVLTLAKLLVEGIVSWIVPVEWLWSISQGIGRCLTLRRRGKNPPGDVIGGVIAAHDAPSAAHVIFAQYRDHRREARLLALALNRPGRRWQPRVRLQGLDHLRASLEQGSGTILWVSGFAHSYIIPLMALHKAGFAVHQLSRAQHGFSPSPFGVRWLNPLWTRIERRFLAERVVIINDDAGPALQLLRERLRANCIVWIAVRPMARRLIHVPFLRGTICLPTGPLHLARMSRAAILPVFTIRASDGAYNVTIERPLDVDRDVTYTTAAQSYVSMLEPYVIAHPEQWSGWEQLIVVPREPS